MSQKTIAKEMHKYIPREIKCTRVGHTKMLTYLFHMRHGWFEERFQDLKVKSYYNAETRVMKFMFIKRRQLK